MPVPHLTTLALALAGTGDTLMHIFFRWGLFGVFLVSIVDSSFVPLPIPGITDIMVVLFAAQGRTRPGYLLLLLTAATVGSALGGWFSHAVGQAGGMQFLEKHVPKRIFDRVCKWMSDHAILSIALPAVLPPPMPLAPFVLAAGALNMSRTRFLTTFTISRLLRHAFAIWLGMHYGGAVLNLWNRFSARYAAPLLIGIWAFILIGVGIAFWRLYKTSKSLGLGRKPAQAR
jgi:membrane protein YqaA with SNARE-associated domain